MVSERGITPSQPIKRRVEVIGASVSGLAVARYLLDEGLEPVVYEQLWDYGTTMSSFPMAEKR